MRLYHPENERLKRQYLQYLKLRKGASDTTLNRAAAAIDRYQRLTKGKPFRKFHREQVVAFRNAYENERNARTGEPLGASTRRAELHALKGFFHWLADQNGFKRRITYSDAEYFNLDNHNRALSNASRPRKYPSLEQIEYVLEHLRDGTPMEKRDRGLFAFAILTGARISALNSARAGDVDLADQLFHQDARWVETKFSKTYSTWFFPVSALALRIFKEYHRWLTQEQLFGPTDPLFPASLCEHVVGKGLQVTGLSREFRKTTQPIREAFRKAFAIAGMDYYHPHSFRHSLAHEARKYCKSLDDHEAWSKNLGHEHLATTLGSYAKMTPERQREIIKGIGKNTKQTNDFQ